MRSSSARQHTAQFGQRTILAFNFVCTVLFPVRKNISTSPWDNTSQANDKRGDHPPGQSSAKTISHTVARGMGWSGHWEEVGEGWLFCGCLLACPAAILPLVRTSHIPEQRVGCFIRKIREKIYMNTGTRTYPRKDVPKVLQSFWPVTTAREKFCSARMLPTGSHVSDLSPKTRGYVRRPYDDWAPNG